MTEQRPARTDPNGASAAKGMEPIYQLEQLIKRYDGQAMVDVDALDVHVGEILAIVGPSGAGKSTLLRLLNFLEPATSGEIIFRRERYPVGQMPSLAQRRRITTVFQAPLLLNRSVWANVAYGLRLRGERDGTDRVQSALQRVRLEHLARRRARTLSGGEGQRVALARALVLEPDVLLLDEPTANLDPYNVSMIEDIIREVNAERGTTVVLVTHNVFQAHRLAHRVALMLEGRIVEVADADTFFEHPGDPRTLAFVRGDMVY